MKRREFIKRASMAALATVGASASRAGAAQKRIAFGGIQIECSTYGNSLSRMQDFTIRRGQELADFRFLGVTRTYPHPFMPILFASAVPGGRVERATYDALKAEFVDRLRSLLPLDGVYLPMHGAMYVEGMTDAEGDWISAVRGVVGERCLISASYDLHGNLSQRIIDNIDMLSAFRTAPHIDREETHKRACDMLVHCLDAGIRPTLVWAPIPVLMPGERSSTEYEPAKRLWAQLPALNARDGVLDVSLLVGYVWADERRATAASVLTGTKPAVLHQTAAELAAQYWEARTEFAFGVPTGTMGEMIEKALALPTQPVVISDSGDNPTGGGTGDRADALAELLRMKVRNAVFAGIADRPATEACYAAGVGKTIALTVGGSLDPQASRPVPVTARVAFVERTDAPAERRAVVEVDGVTLVLTARRRPFHEVRDFTALGLDPKAFKIVVVKAGYLVPEIAAIANPNLMALTDGAVNQDIEHLTSVHRVPTYPFVRDLAYVPRTFVSARSKS
ncbi:MAG TPA: M81 family metallopeptidase [Vicinamibacterales bacterium]|nr:M81 family metallopeptidase [Vicinamibacterales bacterium]HPW21285.1 M81 family metallopeptidase [Vicinamibacterales bacterium]